MSVGATLGVEEEYHLVEASGDLADRPEVVTSARDLLGDDAQLEISTSQLEVATPVCTSLADVRRELVRLRRGAAEAAAAHGCRILASGTHPTARWEAQRLTPRERYVELFERWRLIALQQLIAGCHVHVSVPDAELAIRVVDRLRPDLPLLLAMSGSSPYWEGTDTGCASYRTLWFGRWPITGSPEPLGDRATYEQVVADLATAGLVEDGSHLYWDARPSTRFPTVEIRVADTMPLVDDVVLHAALARALVRVAAAEATADLPMPTCRPELVRAARWRAARFGLDGELLDLRTKELVTPRVAVGRLLARVADVLDDAGEREEVEHLASALLERGTSSRRQRAVVERDGDVLEAIELLARESVP